LVLLNKKVLFTGWKNRPNNSFTEKNFVNRNGWYRYGGGTHRRKLLRKTHNLTKTEGTPVEG